jgi:hypothetical protein
MAIARNPDPLAMPAQPVLPSAALRGSANPAPSDGSGNLQTDRGTALANANATTGSDMPNQDPAPNSASAPVSRRSNRTIIPSSHAETMNRIGDTNKENKQRPDNDEPSLVGIPDWVHRANSYLTTRDLGSEWQGCVAIWMQLEEKLEHGNATKVRSP